jgi:hypothetical protein
MTYCINSNRIIFGLLYLRMFLKTLKKFIYNPFVLTVLGAIFAPIGTDIYNKVPFATTFILIYQFIISVLSCQFPLWLYLLILGLIIGLNRFSRYLTERHIRRNPIDSDDVPIEVLDAMHDSIERENEKRVDKKERMLKYTADKFDLYIWKWEWIYSNALGDYDIKNLRLLCPKLECTDHPTKQMSTYGGGQHMYKCGTCGQTYVVNFTQSAIHKKIREKIETF